MRPTSGTVISNPVLGAIAYEYAIQASQRGFIADILLPIFESQFSTGEYPVIPKEAFLKLPDGGGERAPRTGFGRSDTKFTMASFATSEKGWEELIDDREARLYARYFDAEMVATLRVVDTLLRLREKRAADLLFNDSTFTKTDVSTEWDQAAAADPRKDVKDAKEAMRGLIGRYPNAIAMSIKVFENILICKSFKDHVQYTDPILVKDFEYQRQLMARYLSVENIIVGNAVRDTKKKGQTLVATDIWDDEYVLLAVVGTNARDLQDPCIGRTFMWTGNSPQTMNIETYREEKLASGVVRGKHDLVEKIVSVDAGYLLGNITT